MNHIHQIETKFSFLGKELLQEIINSSTIMDFPANIELVREGQYIKVIPLVLDGLVKVYTSIEEKELLLYYIQPQQSCIMSFSSCLQNDKSKIVAITEEPSTILLMPASNVAKWVTQFPAINFLFYQQYDLRYSELIDTINSLIYHKLDVRIMEFLTERIKVKGKNPIKISHREIATELGTAREVVSRTVKKLEKQNLLKQHADSIEIFFRQ